MWITGRRVPAQVTMTTNPSTARAVERAVYRLMFDLASLFADGVINLDDFPQPIRGHIEALVTPVTSKYFNREEK